MHSRFAVIVIFKEGAPIIERRGRQQGAMVGSDWTWWVCGWYVYREHLWDISRSRQRVSGRSPSGKIESQGIHPAILTVNTMKNGEYT